MTTAARLAWLDALRGLGALAVLLEHLLPWFAPALRPYWFNLGMYGVLVFFLVSGYIIPVSLERRGDVRAFWISRLFRLYPLYLLVAAGVLLTAFWLPVREEVPRDLSSVSAHATMLLDVVHLGGLADTMWTLSYEMVFYLVVTALFVAGLHRGSGRFAVGFGVVAVVAGLTLAAPPLTGPWPAYVSGVVFFAGLACLIGGRFRNVAAYVLGAMAVILLVFAGFVPWLGAAILAVMFTGTAIRRWEEGGGGLRPVAAATALVALAPIWADQAGWWWVQPGPWLATMALAGATFAIAMAARERGLPRFLVRLGLISYSVYLLHHPLLRIANAVVGDVRAAQPVVQLPLSAGLVLVVLGLSTLTYRYVELPMQRLGRRLAQRPSAGDSAYDSGSPVGDSDDRS
ncbi:peptidoglycan/LPS O-acetylase OafA/YrhL [Streptosporangium becharense]|uniref:Peptidoglycan/LPS O-acetylase OafA/YrhL n=1 Tax=Streptosporangium becharense TaxID=1816182 RepID=A0A7W9IFT0_9ACTN|nr:acyltransferase [Streptosporangium becharense]MBB2909512.1 peptidoglycan/LPS O-acetylase OafA/YrhL [Streptosporangium becharense]MBB5819531.1 peptidoglycan/LPS O-acetylase OafA/YrhL [Streptosporangium becharense]